MKKLFLLLTGVLLLAGALSAPVHVQADGGSRPQCPPDQICKP